MVSSSVFYESLTFTCKDILKRRELLGFDKIQLLVPKGSQAWEARTLGLLAPAMVIGTCQRTSDECPVDSLPRFPLTAFPATLMI